MTVVTPQVYLIGHQTVDDVELERFLAAAGTAGWGTDSSVAGEVLAEVGGRLCYQSFATPRPGGNAGYLAHIKAVGHGSVLEHAVYTLLVTGVDRAFTHELVRHRAGVSFSQLSQRYVDESGCEVVCPPALRETVLTAIGWLSTHPDMSHLAPDRVPVNLKLHLFECGSMEAKYADPDIGPGLRWLRNMLRNNDDYKFLSDYLTEKGKSRGEVKAEADPTSQYARDVATLILGERTRRRKLAREAARSVLPNATETKITITLNARAARHFLEMRCSRHADAHMREVAGLVYDKLVAHSPNLFGDYKKVPLPDGSYELETATRKV